MRFRLLGCSCGTFSPVSAFGPGSAHHSAFGSSLTVALVLVLLLLDILVFGPVLGLVLVLIFIRILALGFVYGSVLLRSTILNLFLLFGPGFSFGAHFDSDLYFLTWFDIVFLIFGSVLLV